MGRLAEDSRLLTGNVWVARGLPRVSKVTDRLNATGSQPQLAWVPASAAGTAGSSASRHLIGNPSIGWIACQSAILLIVGRVRLRSRHLTRSGTNGGTENGAALQKTKTSPGQAPGDRPSISWNRPSLPHKKKPTINGGPPEKMDSLFRGNDRQSSLSSYVCGSRMPPQREAVKVSMTLTSSPTLSAPSGFRCRL